MKKLLSLIAFVILAASITFAQTSVTVSKQTAKKVETKAVAKKSTAPVAVKKEVKKATTTASSAKLKSDGTPDMRFKSNKTEKKN